MNKILKSKRVFFIAFVVLLCVFCLRAIGLDKDLPAYGIGAYNPTDEGVYSSIGLNLYNYGSINPSVQIKDDITVTSYTAYHIRTNILENLLVYGGLKLFGDNYYGFRIPMVFVSLINLLLLLRIAGILVKKYGKCYEKDRWFIIAVEAIYTFSFPYLVSSRVVEPTLLRMTFALAAYCVFLSCNKVRYKYFFSGLIITLSLQLVYVTNIFFYIPIFAAGCVEGLKNGKKAFWNSALSCITGCVLSLVAGAAYYYLAWGSNFVSNTLSIFHDFTNLSGYTVATAGGIKAIAGYILDFFGSNIFLFSLPILFFFLMLLPKMGKTIIKEKNAELTYAVMAVAGLLLQTLFTNDYIFRKAFLISPFVVFSIIIFVLNDNYVYSYRNTTRKKAIIVYTAVISVLMLLILWYRFFTNRAGTAGDFSIALKAGTIVVSVLGVSAIIWKMLGETEQNGNKQKTIIVFSIIGLFLLNVIPSICNVWLYNSYSEKELMIELNQYSEQPIFGAYSYGFTLYNDIKPVLLRNEEQNELVEEIPEDFYFIDVSTDNGNYVRAYLDVSMFGQSRYTGNQIKELPREWSLNGNKNKFAIYGVELKDNIVLMQSIEVVQEEDSVNNAIRQGIMINAAIEKYRINKQYEEKRLGRTYEEIYNLLIEENREVEKIYQKYKLSNAEIVTISQSLTSLQITYMWGGTNSPIYGNVYGNINGDVKWPIVGDVFGNIYGNIEADIYGDIYGEVFGEISATVHGEIKSKLTE